MNCAVLARRPARWYRTFQSRANASAPLASRSQGCVAKVAAAVLRFLLNGKICLFSGSSGTIRKDEVVFQSRVEWSAKGWECVLSRSIGIIFLLLILTSSATAKDTLRLIVPGDNSGAAGRAAQAFGNRLEAGGNIEIRYEYRPASNRVLSDFVVNTASIGDTMLVQSSSDLFRAVGDETAMSWRRTLPVAVLATDYQAIAVAIETPIYSLNSLLAQFRANPRLYAVIGASPRFELNHVLLHMILKSAGLNRNVVRYLPSHSTDEALGRFAAGQGSVIIGDLDRLVPYQKAGHLRILATTAEASLSGIDAPPLGRLGIDVRIFQLERSFRSATYKKRTLDPTRESIPISDGNAGMDCDAGPERMEPFYQDWTCFEGVAGTTGNATSSGS